MKRKRNNIILLFIYLVLIILLGLSVPEKVDWRETYSSNDKIPFGDYVLYNRLPDLFPQVSKFSKPVPLYNFYQTVIGNNTGGYSNLIIVNDEFKADDLDVDWLCAYVDSGNNAFIATGKLPKKLRDTLGVDYKVRLISGPRIFNPDSVQPYILNFSNPALHKQGGFSFKNNYLAQDIVDADTTVADTLFEKPGRHLPRIILGGDENGHVNFVRIPYGKGNFYIHSFPLAFTNYYMLKDENCKYAANCLSYLPDNKTYWDEYYKPYRALKAQTPLRFVLTTPALHWAYLTAMLALFIYVVFALKREQRVIPIIRPFKNLSLEFTRTIGTLYFEQKDHHDLAVKKMTYLLEKIRNNYFLPTDKSDAIFQEKLSQKSNVPLETISEIFGIYASQIKNAKNISEATLMKFNSLIENFYNQSGLIHKL